ncbi:MULTISPECIES: CopG family ribbon-helix-helix protein [Peribacillus]|uniref:Antitoxin endoai n=1 Tax=Peribacillus asahii TaxID=228899 RepID=A0A398B151_9BACI|nr:antitoxin endoai [Peribacillus asahii]RID81613.1 antitoxin endoai [Peribacillus asahii]USK60161.1 antitoxin endoai [Peribacillus asahii]USK70590.1 antitoxin endoai [Peribacillus asahii]USK85457.1 antitoxin endoai [Peribacillus asahii]
MSESGATREIIIRLPQNVLTELDGYASEENVNRSEFIYRATTMYLRKKKEFRESMKRGYIEMAAINLTIASEAFQAEYPEYEAEHAVERLASGG